MCSVFSTGEAKSSELAIKLVVMYIRKCLIRQPTIYDIAPITFGKKVVFHIDYYICGDHSGVCNYR